MEIFLPDMNLYILASNFPVTVFAITGKFYCILYNFTLPNS